MGKTGVHLLSTLRARGEDIPVLYFPPVRSPPSEPATTHALFSRGSHEVDQANPTPNAFFQVTVSASCVSLIPMLLFLLEGWAAGGFKNCQTSTPKVPPEWLGF